MQSPVASIRYTLRQFKASPVFTAAAVLTLALGIGGTTAIFTLIHAVMLRSLPVADPESLYRIGDGDNCCVQGGPQDRWGMFSFPLFERIKADAPEFEQLTAFQAGGSRVSVRRPGVDVAARSLRTEYVTGNYFTTFGIGAFGGRVFTQDDDTPASAAGCRDQSSLMESRPTAATKGWSAARSSSKAIRSPSPAWRLQASSATRCATIRPTSGFRCSRSR